MSTASATVESGPQEVSESAATRIVRILGKAPVYLVTEVSIPALRNARRLMSFIAARDRSPHLEVILNRFNAKEIEIDETSATKALGRPLDWKIPNDFQSVRTAENTGVPLALKVSPISKVMAKMAVSAAGKPARTAKRPRTLRGLFQ